MAIIPVDGPIGDDDGEFERIKAQLAEMDVGAEMVGTDSPTHAETHSAPTDSISDSAFSRKLAEAAEEYIAAGLRCQELEVEIADRKESLKLAEEMRDALGVRLRGMRAGMPAQLDLFPGECDDCGVDGLPVRREAPEPPRPAIAHIRDRLHPITATPDAPGTKRWEPPRTRSSTWRDSPVTELDIETIHGAGPKKIQRLLEGVPTVGQLEDLRIAALGQCLPLSKYLPVGCGEAFGEELGKRLLVWLSKNRDAPAAAQAPQGLGDGGTGGAAATNLDENGRRKFAPSKRKIAAERAKAEAAVAIEPPEPVEIDVEIAGAILESMFQPGPAGEPEPTGGVRKCAKGGFCDWVEDSDGTACRKCHVDESQDVSE